MTFRKPVFVGDVMCIYTDLIRIGKTSITVHVEAWVIRRNEAGRASSLVPTATSPTWRWTRNDGRAYRSNGRCDAACPTLSPLAGGARISKRRGLRQFGANVLIDAQSNVLIESKNAWEELVPGRRKVTEIIFGAPLDPFSRETRQHVVLVAFLAWIGLGADGLSSSCYGPEEAFLALGEHRQLGLYLAVATGITVFVIALAYNQVIELFPSGGGGYKVATNLLGPHAGLVSGSGLIVDYILTIAISVASGVDAPFSLFPRDAQFLKLGVEVAWCCCCWCSTCAACRSRSGCCCRSFSASSSATRS